MNCPDPQSCVLCVKQGAVFCQTHETTLRIDPDPPGAGQVLTPVTMRHALYTAWLSAKGPGHVVIDEEQ